MLPAARKLGFICLVLVAGCAGLKETPPVAVAPLGITPPPAAPAPDQLVLAEPPLAAAIAEAAAPEPAPAGPSQPAISGNETAGNEPVALAAAPPVRSQSAAKTKAQRAKAPATISAAAVPVEPPQKSQDPPPAATRPEPPLDVAALKARLRDTKAIGVFTKLALKNQVDDLLKQFRTHYLSGQKTGVAALRQPYDMLVLKVLALVQDGDPSLARTISGSREAIWGILADPVKFNSVS